jgi:antitoxin component of RelBE/YafQ-DinJ toxin-antitoxin module
MYIDRRYNMRKQFTTTIDEDIQNNFKSACAKDGMPMNNILEVFMKAYYEGKFKMELKYESENNQ